MTSPQTDSPEVTALADGLRKQWAGINQFGPQLARIIVIEFGYRQTATPAPDTGPSDESRVLSARLRDRKPAYAMMSPHIAQVAVDFLGYRPS